MASGIASLTAGMEARKNEPRDSGEAAIAKRRAGADLVQLYSGFIYRGPPLVGECARALKLAAD